ncbi:hypothetical protein SELMODRAFT_416686 [Selaginella moellendorffii]|uniref:Uncharacterized protein n=1 Tax=Selaginella moellendorffii TaxID=88036 RepID=D8S035_SELML|nr:hypothetical protein SELMODRAFT_416686 [Selaginella moellendorffii]
MVEEPIHRGPGQATITNRSPASSLSTRGQWSGDEAFPGGNHQIPQFGSEPRWKRTQGRGWLSQFPIPHSIVGDLSSSNKNVEPRIFREKSSIASFDRMLEDVVGDMEVDINSDVDIVDATASNAARQRGVIQQLLGLPLACRGPKVRAAVRAATKLVLQKFSSLGTVIETMNIGKKNGITLPLENHEHGKQKKEERATCQATMTIELDLRRLPCGAANATCYTVCVDRWRAMVEEEATQARQWRQCSCSPRRPLLSRRLVSQSWPCSLSHDSLAPTVNNALLYGLAAINCLTWMVHGRADEKFLVEAVNAFGFGMELVYTVRKGLRLLLTLDCIGIATTLAATGLPCLIRLFPHPDAPPASILVALAACVCNLFWAIFSFLAGNYAMMIATSGAACFGGLLALLSWF